MSDRIHHCWEIGDVFWDYAELADGRFHLRGEKSKSDVISVFHPYYMGVYTAKMESTRIMAERWPQYRAATEEFYKTI